jgi:DNA polymerase III epsilon subunit-like protein
MANLLFLDVEATGIEKEDRLLQVAYRFNGGDRNELFKPPVPIKLQAMSVHHVTERMVEDKPLFDHSAVKQELQLLSAEGYILVAHNAKYDLGMLAKEGITFPRFIDTLKIARHIDKGGRFENYQLQYLRYFYGVEVEAVAHDAFGDIVVLEAVFKRLYNDFATHEGFVAGPPTLDGVLERMILVSSLPSLLNSINFGKYAGQKIAEVAKRDRGYLEWLLGQKQQNPDGEEDWIYTLKHHLKR